MLAIVDMTEFLKLGVRSLKCNIVEVCGSLNYAQNFFFYCCTVHSDVCRVHWPTNALLL